MIIKICFAIEAKRVEPENRKVYFCNAFVRFRKKISQILCLLPPTQKCEAHDESKKKNKVHCFIYYQIFSESIKALAREAKRPCYHRMIHQSLTTKVRDISFGSHDVLSPTLTYANLFAFAVVRLGCA